uniref:Uncharacterized protein n=1 Tax=Myoviridae sp. cts9u10 TaxID=2825187 RepID=A0A8S5NYK3_9CAUD|nr:MAG TPA: hypothetical protein [Myoviridae sp. cts9u10]
MAQRYTTFIPGYVFNIFRPLYTRVGIYPYTFYTTIVCCPVNLFCAKIFLNKMRNIELSLRASSSVFYELMKCVSISLFTSHKICTA